MYKKTCLKEGKVRRKRFSNKIIITMSHKVCRLLSSPVRLRKLTKDTVDADNGKTLQAELPFSVMVHETIRKDDF